MQTLIHAVHSVNVSIIDFGFTNLFVFDDWNCFKTAVISFGNVNTSASCCLLWGSLHLGKNTSFCVNNSELQTLLLCKGF